MLRALADRQHARRRSCAWRRRPRCRARPRCPRRPPGRPRAGCRPTRRSGRPPGRRPRRSAGPSRASSPSTSVVAPLDQRPRCPGGRSARSSRRAAGGSSWRSITRSTRWTTATRAARARAGRAPPPGQQAAADRRSPAGRRAARARIAAHVVAGAEGDDAVAVDALDRRHERLRSRGQDQRVVRQRVARARGSDARRGVDARRRRRRRAGRCPALGVPVALAEVERGCALEAGQVVGQRDAVVGQARLAADQRDCHLPRARVRRGALGHGDAGGAGADDQQAARLADRRAGRRSRRRNGLDAHRASPSGAGWRDFGSVARWVRSLTVPAPAGACSAPQWNGANATPVRQRVVEPHFQDR